MGFHLGSGGEGGEGRRRRRRWLRREGVYGLSPGQRRRGRGREAAAVREGVYSRGFGSWAREGGAVVGEGGEGRRRMLSLASPVAAAEGDRLEAAISS